MSFGTNTKIIFRIFKRVSDWFIFPNSYLHYIKYRNFILFPGDENFRKRSVARNNSLNLILISEAAAWKFFSMGAFAKGSSNISYVACMHFVTWRINLIRYMLNKFKTEFKNFFFSFLRISLQKPLTGAFQGFLSKFK